MDSSIMTDKQEDESIITPSQPPTNIITVKNQYTVKDQDEMLTLAQKKFDDLRRKNKERVRSSRYQRLSRGGSRISKPNHEQTKVNQVLSSLLYLSLMMHKVDDMKKILRHCNSNTYDEWIVLLGSLHSPIFHMRERRIQNERVKKIFDRKNKYKIQYEETKVDLVKSQDILQELSKTMAKLTEDNRTTHVLLNERRNVEKDLASTRTESEMRQNKLLKQEDAIKELKSECSQLHVNIEKLQAEHGKLLQSITTHENNAEITANDIVALRNDIDVKCKQEQEYKCLIVALEKDLEAHRKQYSQEQQLHETTKHDKQAQLQESKSQLVESQSLLKVSENNLQQTELKKSEEISVLQQKMADVSTHAATQTAELAMIRQQLVQTRKDLDSKATDLKEALDIIKVETDRNQCLQEKQSSLMKDIVALNASVETAKADNHHLTQSVATLENNLKSGVSAADEKVNGIKCELVTNELQLIKTEKEVSVLNCTISSLEKSLSEALQLKTSAKEQKQKILDGEAKSINLSIEKLAAENLQITQMMALMKDSLMQDVHNALEQRKVSEDKAALLQKQLVRAEKEIAVLMCTKATLETSLSEAVKLKTSAEEQKQNLIDGKTETFYLSFEKLTEENCRINKMMTSMKESLMQDVHNAIEQQKNAEEKAGKLQKQLVEAEKEITILKSTNKSFEKSLSEALESKISAEKQKQQLIDDDTNSFNSSIQKLSSDNLRLTEMMASMKDTLLYSVRSAIEEHKILGQNSNSCVSFEHVKIEDVDNNRDIDQKPLNRSSETDMDLRKETYIVNDVETAKDKGNVVAAATEAAQLVVNMALKIAIDKIST